MNISQKNLDALQQQVTDNANTANYVTSGILDPDRRAKAWEIIFGIVMGIDMQMNMAASAPMVAPPAMTLARRM